MTTSRRNFLSATAAIGTASLLPISPTFAQAPQKWDQAFDVIVIGSGGAGLAAAVTAAQDHAKTVVLEKMGIIGGNTLITGGAFNAVDPVEQQKKGIEDSPAKHAAQTLKAGDYRGDPELVKTLAENAPKTLQWLKDQGVQFAPGIYQVYGGLYPRAHNTVKPFGQGFLEPLIAKCEQYKVPILLEHKVIKLYREKELAGRVVGVQIQDANGKTSNYQAKKGVVIAAGGFAANPRMRALFDPRLFDLQTTNQPGATGDLIPLAEDVGAQTVGMDFIQLLPGGKSNGQFIGAISPVENVIFVNKEGNRFLAEDSRRDVVADAVLAAPDKVVFPILDVNGYNGMKAGARKAFDGAFSRGDAFKGDTLEDLAIKIGVPAENLKKAVAEYNQAVDTKKDPFGRAPTVLINKIEKSPFYAGRLSMAVHHTMGGIKINAKAQVIDRYGKVIPGLFAAGEVTGGIHGTNRVGGNAIADIFTFGQIAGRNAATLR